MKVGVFLWPPWLSRIPLDLVRRGSPLTAQGYFLCMEIDAQKIKIARPLLLENGRVILVGCSWIPSRRVHNSSPLSVWRFACARLLRRMKLHFCLSNRRKLRCPVCLGNACLWSSLYGFRDGTSTTTASSCLHPAFCRLRDSRLPGSVASCQDSLRSTSCL